MSTRRVNVRAILADPDLRRKLMVPALQATQAREGIETTKPQAERAYYIVTEGERSTFLGLEQFKGGKGHGERRHEAFTQILRGQLDQERFDVARRDFGAIEGSPLAYRRMGVVAHIFKNSAPIEPGFGRARQGAGTADDPRYVRRWWEVPRNPKAANLAWVPFAKGGDFARFYSDIDLRVHWDTARGTFAHFHGRKGREQDRPVGAGEFFKPGLTWPRAGGFFSVRWLPAGCVFADKGPVILPNREEDTAFLAAILCSEVAEYILGGLVSRESMGARWEVGVVKRLPVPDAPTGMKSGLARLGQALHDAKASWDEGNEISTSFRTPWLLRADLALNGAHAGICERLAALALMEEGEETRLRNTYSELNDAVYALYEIPEKTRILMQKTLGSRPTEVLWPQLDGHSAAQKRMEHTYRLLSHAVRRVVDEDNDGIVPFTGVGGEASLLDRVHAMLATIFPSLDVRKVEVDIANELKKKVKGYRSVSSIAEWLENVFFEYHASLYKNRPVIWHIASAQGTSPCAFGVLVDYHRFDKNHLAKLRGGYLRDAVESFRREAGLADKEGRAGDRAEWQARVEEAQALDLALQRIQEGRVAGAEDGPQDYRILTPWKAAAERPRGWDPDLDDGVKVNIEPFEKAGALRVAKVT